MTLASTVQKWKSQMLGNEKLILPEKFATDDEFVQRVFDIAESGRKVVDSEIIRGEYEPKYGPDVRYMTPGVGDKFAVGDVVETISSSASLPNQGWMGGCVYMELRRWRVVELDRREGVDYGTEDQWTGEFAECEISIAIVVPDVTVTA